MICYWVKTTQENKHGYSNRIAVLELDPNLGTEGGEGWSKGDKGEERGEWGERATRKSVSKYIAWKCICAIIWVGEYLFGIMEV